MTSVKPTFALRVSRQRFDGECVVTPQVPLSDVAQDAGAIYMRRIDWVLHRSKLCSLYPGNDTRTAHGDLSVFKYR